jgi:hypothetical protein
MPCLMTSGYNDRTCTNGKGGIRSVLLFPVANYSGATLTANEITAITVTGETFHYKLKSNLSSYTAPIQRSEENGTLWYEQALSMVLNSDTKELRSAIHLLAQNELACMVEKANGTYVMLGYEEGMKVSDGNEYTSGVAKSDRNGHLISLVSQENNEVPDVDATVAATLIAQSSYAV